MPLTIDEIRKALETNLEIANNNNSAIQEAKNNNTTALNYEFETAIPEMVSLMLLAKKDSPSRTKRKDASGGQDNYQPFVIASPEEFTNLKDIIQEKQGKGEEFRFNFINIAGGHCSPVEIMSDGIETNLFSVDAFGLPDKSLKELAGEDSNLNIYGKGRIQKTMGCAIFAIQNSNTIYNMDLFEKKKISNDLSTLDPRFLKMTQSLSILTEEHISKNIKKPGKQAKTLKEEIEENSVKILTKEVEKPQNKNFDRIFFKYLTNASAKLDELINGNTDANKIITDRMKVDLSYNTYQPSVYQEYPNAKTHTALKSLNNGSEIAKELRTIKANNRATKKIQNLLIEKIPVIASSNDANKGQQFRDILLSFPKDQRDIFCDTFKDIFPKLTTKDASLVLSALSSKKRSEYIPHVKELLNSAPNSDTVKDLLNTFNADERNNFIPEVKKLLKNESSIDVGYDIINSFSPDERDNFLDQAKKFFKPFDSSYIAKIKLVQSFKDDSQKKNFPLLIDLTRNLQQDRNTRAVDRINKEFPALNYTAKKIQQAFRKHRSNTSSVPPNNTLSPHQELGSRGN